MSDEASIRPFLEHHLQAILDADVGTYHATTVPELTIYEWYVTPHRIDGLGFHDFLMAEAARPDTPATALDPGGRAVSAFDKVPSDVRDKVPGQARDKDPSDVRDKDPSDVRDKDPSDVRDGVPSEERDKGRQQFDLANYREQVYGDCAVCSYTLLISRATSEGTVVRSHHETRVLVRAEGKWKVVHVHKSPAWNAPYQAPG